MPFSLPSPRLFVQHLPSQAPPAGDKAVATGRVPTPKPSAPLSAVVPALSDAEIKQWVSVPPSFHNHAAVVYTALSSNVTVDNVVAGSNLSIRSPMAQPVVFDLLARAVQWVAAKGEVFARDLFREVVGDAWAKSEAWGEAQGWEWVRDLAGPGVVAGGLQSAEDTIGWRNALHGMSSGTGPFGRDDKQAERIELWLKCWDTVNNARLEAMIAEQEVSAYLWASRSLVICCLAKRSCPLSSCRRETSTRSRETTWPPSRPSRPRSTTIRSRDRNCYSSELPPTEHPSCASPPVHLALSKPADTLSCLPTADTPKPNKVRYFDIYTALDN